MGPPAGIVLYPGWLAFPRADTRCPITGLRYINGAGVLGRDRVEQGHPAAAAIASAIVAPALFPSTLPLAIKSRVRCRVVELAWVVGLEFNPATSQCACSCKHGCHTTRSA